MRKGTGLHERAFRALLRGYPRWFRQAYGEEMCALFRARLARCQGRRGVARLWVQVLVDFFSAATALRRKASDAEHAGEDCGPPGARRRDGCRCAHVPH